MGFDYDNFVADHPEFSEPLTGDELRQLMVDSDPYSGLNRKQRRKAMAVERRAFKKRNKRRGG